MGVSRSQMADWARLVQNNIFELNFYRAHLLYFVLTSLIAAAVLYASNTHGFHVEYTDALFICVSAMTNTGLSTLNLSAINGYQQSIIFVMMILGDLSVASVSVVYVRRYYFGKKIRHLLKHSKTARRIAEDIEENRQSQQSHALGETISKHISGSSSGTEIRRGHSNRNRNSRTPTANEDELIRESPRHRFSRVNQGYGSFPAPWQTSAFDKLWSLPGRAQRKPHPVDHHYLTFSPDIDEKGRFQNLTSEQLAELGGVEYRALGVLTWLLPAYSLFWLLFTWVILVPYSSKNSIAKTIKTSEPGPLNPQWWAFFVGLSAYSNCGMDLLDSSMTPFAHDYLILIITGATILAGNTFYPIFLRLTVWALSKLVPKHSQMHHSLAFLLHHPRRCFLFLFPKKNTWYLLGVQVGIFMLLWLAFGVLNIGYGPVSSELGPGQWAMDGLYQAHGVRSSGFYIINPSSLAPAAQIYFMVNMYISAVPFILSLRSTNVYEERSVGVDSDADKDPERKNKKQDPKMSPSIQTHLQNQLAYDIWWIVLSVFLITVIERTPLATPAPGFSIFSIIFEVVSAYGTVGLSLGVPYDNYSFCGTWRKLSKLILMTVMLRGRHRILPLAVDRAVLVPGQELMERLDHENSGRDEASDEWKHDEDIIRKQQSGAQAEYSGGRQDPERSSETEKGTDHAGSRKGSTSDNN